MLYGFIQGNGDLILEIFLRFSYIHHHIKSWDSNKVMFELNPNGFQSWGQVCWVIKGRNGTRDVDRCHIVKSLLCYTRTFGFYTASHNESPRKLNGRVLWSDVNFTRLIWKARQRKLERDENRGRETYL